MTRSHFGLSCGSCPGQSRSAQQRLVLLNLTLARVHGFLFTDFRNSRGHSPGAGGSFVLLHPGLKAWDGSREAQKMVGIRPGASTHIHRELGLCSQGRWVTQ